MTIWIILISKITSIKTFVLSKLYTTVPRDNSKTCLQEIIHKAFHFKTSEQGCKLVWFFDELSCFDKHEPIGKRLCSDSVVFFFPNLFR